MKTLARSHLLLCLSGILLANAAQAGTFADEFNTSRNYLTNGVIGSSWDGVYFGAGAFQTNVSFGGGPGSTSVCDANTSSNNTLSVTSVATDWEGGPDDGFFLFKNVNGDFSVWVHIMQPFDIGAYNSAGLLVRAVGANGAPLGGQENHLSLTRFNQFSIGNYFRNETNSVFERFTNPDGGTDTNPSYWLRLDRVNGTNFNAYVAEVGPSVNDWVQCTSPIDANSGVVNLVRPDFAGLTLQVGIMHATYDVTARSARFEHFSLSGTNVNDTTGEAAAATGLTVATNAGSGKLAISWTPGVGSAGSVVVMRPNSPITVSPVDGTPCAGSENFGSGTDLGGSNYVVYAGPASSVTVSNLSAVSTYRIAVYAYTESGGTTNYTLAGVPTASAAPPATLTSITLQLPATLQTNGIAQAIVLANYDAGTPQNVAATAAYTSSATSVFTVSAAGQVTGVGTAVGANSTITAVYQGKTNQATVTTVAPPPAALAHRYSFTADANDSVGVAHGTLVNGATIVNGTVDFPANGPATIGSGGGAGDYVDLPNNLVSNLSAVSFEVWLTDNGSANWGRVYDFGNSTGGENTSAGGSTYMFLSVPGGGTTSCRAAYAYAPNAIETGHQLNWTAGNGGRPLAGKRTHMVFTSDAETRRAALYVDGVVVATSTTFTNSPAKIGATLNNWLGRAQFNDPFWWGSIDEFRIWSNALPSIQVAMNAAAGPDAVVSDPGALQTITLKANTSMMVGAFQSAGVAGNYANVSGVNIMALGPTFTSDNTNILTVTAAGRITAVALGTATIQAAYGGKTDSKTITVSAVPPPTLAHRYSFNTDASDSVGSAHGALVGNTTIANGRAVFDVAGGISLPAGVINNFPAVTVEAWINFPDLIGGPMYLFSIGDALAGGTIAANYVRLAVVNGTTLETANTTLTLNGPVINSGVPIGAVSQNAGWGSQLNGSRHVACVIDPPRGAIRLYVDGQIVSTNSVTAQLTTNNAAAFIGQSLLTAEVIGLLGQVDEFRIYNGALSLQQVRTSLAAGPTNAVFEAGPITSLTLTTPPNMIAGARRLAVVNANSATVTNLNLTRSGLAAPVAGLTLTSSDPSVISITADGRLQAVNPGYAKVTATMGTGSDSKWIVVSAKQPALMHRYSFTADATDSVGGANGILWGHAATNVTGGGAILDYNRSTYIQLPPNIIDGYAAVTLEGWATINPTAGAWTRLFDFGNYGTGNPPGGNAYVFVAPHTGVNTELRAVLNDGVLGEQAFNRAGVLNEDSVQHHIVTVVNTDTNLGPKSIKLYVDGLAVGTNTFTGTATNQDLTRMTDNWNFIGRSLYGADNYMSATINEVRVYHGVLDSTQVAANFAAGPDGAAAVGSPTAPAPKLYFSVAGGNLVLSWSSLATGYTLKSTSDFVSWAPVTVGPPSDGLYSVTVPASGGMLYFRLEK